MMLKRENGEVTFPFFKTLFIIIIYLEPPFVAGVSALGRIDYIWSLFKILFFYLIFLLWIMNLKNKSMPKIPALLMSIIFGNQLITTIIHNGFISHMIIVFSTILAPIMWISINYRNIPYIIKVLRIYLYILVFINLIFMIFVPNGLYNVSTTWGHIEPYWILGSGNNMATFILLTSTLSAYYISYEKHPIDVISQIVCMITVLIAGSATLIVGYFLFMILLLAYMLLIKKNKQKKSYINVLLSIVVSVFIIIVIVGKTSYFSYIIIDILHKDLTLTTRTKIWDLTMEALKGSPLFGYGLMTMEDVRQMIRASHQHNYYLHILFQGGLISFVPFVVFINLCRKKINAIADARMAILSFSLFSYLIIFITEVYSDELLIFPFFLLAFIIYTYDEKEWCENEK